MTSSNFVQRFVRVLYGRRQLATPGASLNKPSASTALIHSSRDERPRLIAAAIDSGELNRRTLEDVLTFLRRYRRFDVAYDVAMLYNQKVSLKAHHFTSLFAHAADLGLTGGHWRRALDLWPQLRRVAGPVPPQPAINAFGRLLAVTGRWKHAIILFTRLAVDERRPPDTMTMMTALTAARMYASWNVVLNIFSGLIRASTAEPNSKVYLEVVRALEMAPLSYGAWEVSLALASAAITNKNLKPNVGIVNSALVSLRSAPSSIRYELAESVLLRMADVSLAPSSRTVELVMSYAERRPSRMKSLLDHCRAYTIPMTSAMYALAFDALCQSGRTATINAFVEQVVEHSLANPSDTTTPTRDMFIGLMDSLLLHPQADVALQIASTHQHRLNSVVGEATGELAGMGSLSQRWIVEGSVAIASYDFVLKGLVESLLDRVDNVLIPCDVVRSLVLGASKINPQISRALENLQKTLQNEASHRHRLRVLPFLHQLQAHKALQTPPAKPALEPFDPLEWVPRDRMHRQLAVAVMIQSLNPTAVVGIVGGNPAVLDRWRVFGGDALMRWKIGPSGLVEMESLITPLRMPPRSDALRE